MATSTKPQSSVLLGDLRVSSPWYTLSSLSAFQKLRSPQSNADLTDQLPGQQPEKQLNYWIHSLRSVRPDGHITHNLWANSLTNWHLHIFYIQEWNLRMMFFENPEAKFLCIHSIFCNSLIMMKSKFKHKEKWEHYTQTEMKINTFNYPFSKTMMVLGTALLTNSARRATDHAADLTPSSSWGTDSSTKSSPLHAGPWRPSD